MPLPDCLLPRPIGIEAARYSAALDEVEADFLEMQRAFEADYASLFGRTPDRDMRRTNIVLGCFAVMSAAALAAVFAGSAPLGLACILGLGAVVILA
jgi:hypothetical protein